MIVGSVHEVIDQELRTPPEKIFKRGSPFIGIEATGPVDRNRWQLLPLLRERVAVPRQLLLGLKQCCPRGQPLLACPDPTCRHLVSPLMMVTRLRLGAGHPAAGVTNMPRYRWTRPMIVV